MCCVFACDVYSLHTIKLLQQELEDLRNAHEQLQTEAKDARTNAQVQLERQEEAHEKASYNLMASLSKHQRRANAERSTTRFLKLELDKTKIQLRSLRSYAHRKQSQREAWRARCIRVQAVNRAHLSPKRAVFRKGGRLTGAARTLYYKLYSFRVSARMQNEVIKCCAEFFGVTINEGSLASRALIGDLAIEAGVWSLQCASHAMGVTKEWLEEHGEGKDFTIGESGDGTTKEATSYLTQASHFPHPFGPMQSAITGVAFPENKKAITQKKAMNGFINDRVKDTKHMRLGVLARDYVTRISDKAANEVKTNKLLKRKHGWLSCGHHNATNAVRHGVSPTVTTHLIACTCGVLVLEVEVEGGDLIMCVVCETWFHELCVNPSLQPIPSFVCARCLSVGAKALTADSDLPWDKASEKLRAIVKGLSSSYGKGVGQDWRNWAASKNHKIETLARDIGDRFFGVFYSGATILVMRELLRAFVAGEFTSKAEVTQEWFVKEVDWLSSEGGELFLCICAVLHASYGKDYFKKFSNLTVAEAYEPVHATCERLEKFSQEPAEALKAKGRGMDLVLVSPRLVELKCRLGTIFTRMHKRWVHYFQAYWSGGAACWPELSEEQRIAMSNTPCHTTFVESFFGVLTDVIKHAGPTIHPLRAGHLAVYRKNHRFNTDLPDHLVGGVIQQTQELKATIGSRKELRARTYNNKKKAEAKKSKPKAPVGKGKAAEPVVRGFSRRGRAIKPNKRYVS